MVGGLQAIFKQVSRPVERVAPVAAREVQARAGAAMAPDALQLSKATQRSASDLERSALAHLQQQKVQEALATLTPERAARLVQLPDDQAFYDQIKYMAPEKLRTLARLEPSAAAKFDAYAARAQRDWMKLVDPILQPLGLQAHGAPKHWESMLGRMDRNSEKFARRGRTLPEGRPMPSTAVDLHDISRGRVDLPTLDPRQLRTVARTLEEGLNRIPGRSFSVSLWDRTTPQVLGDSHELYRGRLHVRVQDVTGGVPRGVFELQLGPRSLSEYWDRSFQIPGVPEREFSIHDAIYKGIATIQGDSQLEAIGRDRLHGAPVSRAQALQEGQSGVAKALNAYEQQLQAALDVAREGKSFDYDRTLDVRKRIAKIYKAVQGVAPLPEGLVGRPPR